MSYSSIQAIILVLVGLLIACSGQESTSSKLEEEKKGISRYLAESKENLPLDTFDYQSLFVDDKLLIRKTKAADEWNDTLGGGLYWLNLDVLEPQASQQLQAADPDPPHDYFVALDFEPQVMNLDSVLESIRIDPDIRQQVGPSRIWIKLLINRDGRPKDYFVVRSPDNRISREILEKLRFIKAKPGKLQGKSVKCWVNIQYNLI